MNYLREKWNLICSYKVKQKKKKIYSKKKNFFFLQMSLPWDNTELDSNETNSNI